MTHSQIQYLRDASDALKNFAIDVKPDANRRSSKPSWAPDKNVLRIKKQGSSNQLQGSHKQDKVTFNENYGAQSVAISPS